MFRCFVREILSRPACLVQRANIEYGDGHFFVGSRIPLFRPGAWSLSDSAVFGRDAIDTVAHAVWGCALRALYGNTKKNELPSPRMHQSHRTLAISLKNDDIDIASDTEFGIYMK